jgi:hypothetical protein
MWNLEETERLVLRMLPIVVLLVVCILTWMTLQLQPHRLSRAFEPQRSASVFVQSAE